MVCKTLSPVYLIVYEVDDYDDNITLQTSGFFFNEDFLELAEKFTFTTKLLNHFHSLSAFKNILRSCLMKDRKQYNRRILKPSFFKLCCCDISDKNFQDQVCGKKI